MYRTVYTDRYISLFSNRYFEELFFKIDEIYPFLCPGNRRIQPTPILIIQHLLRQPPLIDKHGIPLSPLSLKTGNGISEFHK